MNKINIKLKYVIINTGNTYTSSLSLIGDTLANSDMDQNSNQNHILQEIRSEPDMSKSGRVVSSVLDPDPCGSILKWLPWIHIQIRIGHTDSGSRSRTVKMTSEKENQQRFSI